MYCDFPFLGRCCFCLPLRKGVLVFGYLNIIFSVCMISLYSYFVKVSKSKSRTAVMVYHGTTFDVPSELCIFSYCLEFVFNALLLYGAHKKIVLYLKIFYYFLITTIVAAVAMQIMDLAQAIPPYLFRILEVGPLLFAGLCIQSYLAILVRSLIKKLEVDGDNVFENQLHQIVTGERKVHNEVYENTTVVAEVN